MKTNQHCTLALFTIGIYQHLAYGSDVNKIRFNKFTLLDDKYSNLLPLGRYNYPVSRKNKVVKMLKEGTNAISVVNDKNDHEVIYNVSQLIEIAGGLPDHPSSDLSASYWKKLNRVIKMRKRTFNDPNKLAKTIISDVMQLPLRWEKYTMHDLAESVHDEYPGLHQSEFVADLVGKKYGSVEFDDSIIPRRAHTQFLRSIVMLADLNTWTIGKVGPHNFAAKWYAGRARPEEVVWKILQQNITAPGKTMKLLGNTKYPGNITSPESFTNYPEGAPRHPSWPAMHSAASNISFWLQVVMKLSSRQLCEAQKVDYAVAYARTIAGVHFEDDNIAGLDMGQEIVARALPRHLKRKFESNLNSVKEKVRSKRFNWEGYNPVAICI